MVEINRKIQRESDGGVFVCSSSIPVTETGRLGINSQHMEFEASLGYMKPVLKKGEKKEKINGIEKRFDGGN